MTHSANTPHPIPPTAPPDTPPDNHEQARHYKLWLALAPKANELRRLADQFGKLVADIQRELPVRDEDDEALHNDLNGVVWLFNLIHGTFDGFLPGFPGDHQTEPVADKPVADTPEVPMEDEINPNLEKPASDTRIRIRGELMALAKSNEMGLEALVNMALECLLEGCPPAKPGDGGRFVRINAPVVAEAELHKDEASLYELANLALALFLGVPKDGEPMLTVDQLAKQFVDGIARSEDDEETDTPLTDDSPQA